MAATRINFLIVHGTLGAPDTNWFPWLAQKLQQDGHTVFAPHFPTPEGQTFAAWHAIAEQSLQDTDPAQTILIGHSAGAIFVLRFAELAVTPYKAVFSVCPFAGDLNLAPYDALNASFVHHRFDWPRIRRNAGALFCFAGDNDPYVPLAKSREVAEKVNAPLTVIAGGGHLNGESGMLEFPLLLDKIRQTIAVSSP